MKKLISTLLAIILLLGCITPIFANSDSLSSEITVKVDGTVIDISEGKPYGNEDGRTMVPVRFVSEHLGCNVDWQPGNIITIKNKSVKIVFNVGDYFANVTDLSTNTTRVAIFDTKAETKDGRTMVAVRFISELLGAKVEWNGNIKQVVITSGAREIPAPITYNRTFSDWHTEKLVYNDGDTFKVEYVNITKDETATLPIIDQIAKLPDCVTVADMMSDGQKFRIIHFSFGGIDPNSYNNLRNIMDIDVGENGKYLTFWLNRYSTTTLALLHNILAILYKDDVNLQDKLYKDIVTRKDVSGYLSEDIGSHELFVDHTNDYTWKNEVFALWGEIVKK